MPLPGREGRVLDTRCGGVLGRAAATAGPTRAAGEQEPWERLWSDPAAGVIDSIGLDRGFGHAVLWPALPPAHGGLASSARVVADEPCLPEDEEFSAGRGRRLPGHPAVGGGHRAPPAGRRACRRPRAGALPPRGRVAERPSPNRPLTGLS